MTTALCSAEDAEAFRGRFFEFFDAVVRHVALSPPTRTSDWSCRLDIEAQDSTTGGWALVTLQLDDVLEFTFSLGRRTFSVLSSGIQLFWQDDRLLVVLDAYPDDPGIPDLSRNIAFVAARRCSWVASPNTHRGGARRLEHPHGNR